MSRWNFFAILIVSFFIVLQIQTGKMNTFTQWQTHVENAVNVPSNSIDKKSVISKKVEVPKKTEIVKTPDFNLKVVAFGDMMLGRYVRTVMEKNGKDYIFQDLNMNTEGPFYGDTDILFANLEGPIKGEGYRHQTAMVFGFHKDTAEFLKKYGFNLLSIANNHSYDQKEAGYLETMTNLQERGISYCGNAKEASRDTVYFGEKDGKKFAFVCFCDVIFDTPNEDMINLIKDIDDEVDLLIVSIHWGTEYTNKPIKKTQVDLGHQFIDAGADFIIGHHPHVVESFEIYNGKFIFYSLGNFIFDQYWSVNTQEQLGIKINFSFNGKKSKAVVQLFPMKSTNSKPKLMEGDELNKWIERFIGYGEYDENMKSQIRNLFVEN
ncbi:MAG: CapA family protein [Candidatus Gracilibacteria bacterium]|jgi:poly-gamma-glutamate synthesis protein (capsule biosynthesis protein)